MEDETATYTVDDALLSLGFGKYQAILLLYSGLVWMADAMEFMLLSFLGPSIQSEWNLSSQQESLITSVVFAGMLIGAYCWGIVSDSYGRRIGFLFTALVTSTASCLSAFSPNYTCLIILRSVVGVGLGGAPVLCSWFLEFIPAPNRGTWMIIFNISYAAGAILEAALAWAIVPSLSWRWLVAISSLPLFLLVVFYCAAPESPRYLCMKGERSAATLILERMAEVNRKTLPLGILVSDCVIENSRSSDEALLISFQKTEASTREYIISNKAVGAFLELLSSKMLRTTLLLWLESFGIAFGYYGIILLTTELTRSCTSKDLVTSDSKNVSIYRDALITSFAEIPGLLLPAIMVDRIGRKLSMSLQLFLSCIFLVPLLFNENEALTTGLLFCARITISGSFTVLHVYALEVYPTSVRTTGFGTATSIGRIGGIVCPLVAVGLVNGCHQTSAILLFELVMLLSGIAAFFFPLETNGIELSDSLHSIG